MTHMPDLRKTISDCSNLNVYRTAKSGNHWVLSRIGTNAQVRHAYNSMVCLIAGLGKKLIAANALPKWAPHAPEPGSWGYADLYFKDELSPDITPEQLYALATTGEQDQAHMAGYLVFRDMWPDSLTRTRELKGAPRGFKGALEALEKFAYILHAPHHQIAVGVGTPSYRCLRDSVQRAMADAASDGYTPAHRVDILSILDQLVYGSSVQLLSDIEV